MKIEKPNGIVLLVALCVMGTAGIIIASYLSRMPGEKRTVSRSQIWNNCVPVMEAGVEEAMAQIQYCNGVTNSFSSNSWTFTNSYYTKQRFLGSGGSYYLAQIQPSSPPIIYCTAYVPIPGTSTNYITRKVRVATAAPQNYPGGIVSKSTITLGRGAYFDSYNSSVAPYDRTKAINLSGVSQIYGKATVGPGGTIAGASGATGAANNDANYNFNDVSYPADLANYANGTLTSGTHSGTNYTYLVSSGKYDVRTLMPNLQVQGGQSMAIVGNVTLVVSNFTIGESGFLYMTTNSSLTMYVSGTFTVSGGGIMNMSTLPANLTIYGLPTCKSVTYSGSAALQGTFDAPEADFTLSGAAGEFGAFVGNSFKISGRAGVHYDQGLQRAQAYVVASWNEL